MIGLAFRLVRFREEELASQVRLVDMVHGLDRLMGGRVKRPYPLGKGRRGSWVTIWLPEEFLTQVGCYAKARGQSRNDALGLFFRDGLLVYLGAQLRFLETIMNSRNQERVSQADQV